MCSASAPKCSVSDPQTAKRKRASAEKRSGRYRPENSQRLCDEGLRGGESGARENLPTTRTHQPQRGEKSGGRAGGNIDGAPAGRGPRLRKRWLRPIRSSLVFRGRKSGAKRETLASRRTSIALDSDRVDGGAEKIPESERLPGTRLTAAPLKSVIDSTGPGRLRCKTPRAAASVSGFN